MEAARAPAEAAWAGEAVVALEAEELVVVVGGWVVTVVVEERGVVAAVAEWEAGERGAVAVAALWVVAVPEPVVGEHGAEEAVVVGWAVVERVAVAGRAEAVAGSAVAVAGRAAEVVLEGKGSEGGRGSQVLEG